MIVFITKITSEGDGDGFSQEVVGQTKDLALVKTINEDYDSKLGKFIGENLTKLEHNEITYKSLFEAYNVIYEARQTFSGTEENSYPEITNINQL